MLASDLSRICREGESRQNTPTRCSVKADLIDFLIYSENKKTSVPYVQPVAIHDIVSANGKF